MITTASIRFSLALLALSLFAGSPALAAESTLDLAARNDAFAFDLYAQLRTGEGNLFFSPYSISTCLAMSYAGARGDTATQMASALHFEADAAGQATAFGALQRQLAPGTKGYELNIANGLWGQTGHSFLSAFLDLARQEFGAKLNQVDFRSQAESARADINDWVSQETRGKITDLIQPGVLNGSTRLVLVNAIYFKGRWAEQFDKKQTASQPFFVTAEQTVTAPLMRAEAQLNYAEPEGCQLLELPYANGGANVPQSAATDRLEMVVLLPREIGGLKKLEAALNQSLLHDWLAQASQRKLQVFLPKFKMTSQFSLGPALGALGMTKPFTGEADFSGMDGARDLFLSAVVHQAYVDVNEEGTEAAAATAGVMKMMAVRPQPEPVFRADHPFLFLIRDPRSGSILFIGRVNDPTK